VIGGTDNGAGEERDEKKRSQGWRRTIVIDDYFIYYLLKSFTVLRFKFFYFKILFFKLFK